MRNLINIVTTPLNEEMNNNEIFEQARLVLTRALTPMQTYSSAVSMIIKALTAITATVEEESHPIKVRVDIFPDDPKDGRLSAHREGAWMVLNFTKTLPNDWGRLTPEELQTVIFRLASAFAHEMMHYKQYCRNWNYFEKKGGVEPDVHTKSDAASAARELISVYGDRKTAIAVLKSSIGDAMAASEAMARNVKGVAKETAKRFLSDLYSQLSSAY